MSEKAYINKFIVYIRRLSIRNKTFGSVLLIAVIGFIFCLPDPLFTTPTGFVITDKNGALLNASIASDGQWRLPASDKVPEKFEKCIVAFEDHRFYYHPGVDPFALLRAVKQNSSNAKTVSGGSTLTMQVMRLQQQNKNRNIWNKLKEMVLAVRLECGYSKRSILSLYAANAPFGTNIVGLDAAAWRYFGRSADKLSWGETAALAVLPNSPALVHPGRNREQLLLKRNRLLDKLQKQHTIDEVTCELAKKEPLPDEPKALPQLAPHLLQLFIKQYNAGPVQFENRTQIQTTIDITLQKKMNELVLMHHNKLKANQIMNAAAMVVEVETGNILSYVGNVYQPKDASLESHVDVLTSPRSPGSSLKPLLYASLLTEGSMLPTQLIPDIPTQIGGYTPQNFDLGYDGAVPAHTALARSLNIPAVKMLQLYNYRKFYDVLKNCGITTLTRPADDYGMSLILGGCEIKPLELAGVYSSMARSYLHQRSDANQWSMPKYFKTQQTEIKTGSWKFNTAALWHTFNAMNEVMRPGEEGLWNLFGASQKIAWKTGTSFGFRDGWAVGITPKYCVIVWIGNTDGEGRAELTGINTAAPLLFDIFRMLPNSAWFTSPTEQFTYTEICKQSGYRAGADCPDQKLMMIPDAGRSSALCPYHRIIHLDASGMYQVNSTCVSPSEMINRSWFILPATIEYYYKQRHADYKQPPPYKADCYNENERSFDIIYPENNTKIYVPKEISGESGRTVFTAAATSSKAKLFWHLDDKFIAETQNFHQIAVGPKQGEHVLTVVDENGIRISRRFVIVDKSSK